MQRLGTAQRFAVQVGPVGGAKVFQHDHVPLRDQPRVPRRGEGVLEDLGSTNGTYLNDELLTGPQPLHPGDRVRIGDSEFVYEDG